MSTPKNGETNRAPAGVILVNHAGTPIYLNTEALAILSYRGQLNHCRSMADLLPAEIRSMLHSPSTSEGTLGVTGLTSGRRRYSCRVFPLSPAVGGFSEKMTALLFDRVNGAADVTGAAEQFNLTRREQQTVGLLTLGLTSKEIATRMNVSPNTVKTFFRLVMMKMGVNTRAGIVGKLARM